MITNDGSSRSQSEVHERNLDEKIATADKRNISFLVNDYLIPILINQGYSIFNENDKFSFTAQHNLDLDKYWAIVKGIMEDYEVDENWLSQTFFVPITGKKKRVNSTNSISAVANVSDVFFPLYPEACCEAHDYWAASEPFTNRMQVLHDQLAKEVWENKDSLSSRAQITAAESLEFISGLIDGWGDRRIQASWNEPDHLALALMEQNIFNFSASKVEARLASMSQLMIDKEKLQIRSFTDFKNEASKVVKSFNENWLRAEYNLSIATGQNAAAYLRFMSEKDTVTSYVQYQTAGDNKVRGSHQMLDGKIFNLSDKSARSLWPPNGYGCRCEMVQYIGSTKGKVTKGEAAVNLLPDSFKDSHFDINRGDTKEVFTKGQFYTKKKGVLAKLNDMNYKDTYNLKAWQSFKNNLKPLKMDKTITGENVKELFVVSGKQGSKFMGYEDYLKRKIILKQPTFENHVKGKYLNKEELRHQLFPHLKGIMNNPDEVWLYNSGIKDGYSLRYIKFYKDRAVVVECDLGVNNYEIRTWYNIKDDETIIRKGLLINNKPFKAKGNE